MKKIFITLLLFIFFETFSLKTFSQKPVFKYSLISNSPDKAKNLNISLLPVMVDLNDLNLTLGGKGGISFRIKNVISLEASYQIAYLDRLEELGDVEDANQALGYSSRYTTPAQTLELGGKIYFVRKMKDVTEKVKMKEVSTGFRETTIHLLAVPGKQLILFGLRGALINSSNFIHSNNGNIIFKGYELSGGSPSSASEFSGQNYSTMMDTKVIAVGLSRTKISDITVDIEKVGVRSSQWMSDIYLDFLYGSNITYQNMIIDDGYDSTLPAKYNVDDLTAKMKYGFRLGITQSQQKTIGIHYGLEIGYKPGPDAGINNGYLLLKVGMLLNARL